MTICQIQYASPEYDAALRLRYKILREPLQLDYEVNQIEAEWDSFHFGIYDGDSKLVGCLTLESKSEEVIKMRQVVIDESAQKAGLGTALVLATEQWCADHQYKKIVLHARDLAVPFYQKLNYKIEGEPFTEVSIIHFKMYKDL